MALVGGVDDPVPNAKRGAENIDRILSAAKPADQSRRRPSSTWSLTSIGQARRGSPFRRQYLLVRTNGRRKSRWAEGARGSRWAAGWIFVERYLGLVSETAWVGPNLETLACFRGAARETRAESGAPALQRRRPGG